MTKRFRVFIFIIFFSFLFYLNRKNNGKDEDEDEKKINLLNLEFSGDDQFLKNILKKYQKDPNFLDFILKKHFKLSKISTELKLKTRTRPITQEDIDNYEKIYGKPNSINRYNNSQSKEKLF